MYVKLGGTDCKIGHIFLDFDGVHYFSSGFVYGHLGLNFMRKNIGKIIFFRGENEEGNFRGY